VRLAVGLLALSCLSRAPAIDAGQPDAGAEVTHADAAVAEPEYTRRTCAEHPLPCQQAAACLTLGRRLTARATQLDLAYREALEALRPGLPVPNDDERFATHCDALAALERACHLGSTRGCDEAVRWLDGEAALEFDCHEREVCARVGAAWCLPGCEGTEVNLGVALSSYRRACELGDARGCVRGLKIAAGMEDWARAPGDVHGYSGCAALTGSPAWSTWSASRAREIERMPESTPLAVLCRDRAKYCDGFSAPCSSLAVDGGAP
jgi:TPR repeat protein